MEFPMLEEHEGDYYDWPLRVNSFRGLWGPPDPTDRGIDVHWLLDQLLIWTCAPFPITTMYHGLLDYSMTTILMQYLLWNHFYFVVYSLRRCRSSVVSH